MPESPTPRASLGDLARKALAAPPAQRLPLVLQLARGTRSAEHLEGLLDLLLANKKAGPTLTLEWLARLRLTLSPGSIERTLPLLASKSIPSSTRVAVAARFLRDLPDQVEAIRPVTKSLTIGLAPLRALERLRQLQHQVEKGAALDSLIERRERRVKLDCPRCGVQLTRIDMVKHLWFVHGVFLERGKVREAEALAAEARTAFVASADVETLDRAVLLGGPDRTESLRNWVAASQPSAEETAPLRADAEEQRCGLCPGCFSHLPEPVPALPASLSLHGGRLTGEGYLVEVGGASWFRTIHIETPEKLLKSGPDRGHMLSPRGLAALVAACILLLGAALTLFLPHSIIKPIATAGASMLFAAFAYGAIFALRRPLPAADDRAIDAAWTVLARRIAQRESGFRYLTRLSLSSLGHGDPVERVSVLKRVLDYASDHAADSDEAVQLLAAVRVLQAWDANRSPDRSAAIANLAAAGFRGDAVGSGSGAQYGVSAGVRGGTDYAEHIVGSFLRLDPSLSERARLRINLLTAAFEAGLKPRDLVDLWSVAPNLRAAMAVQPLHRLGLLFGLWVTRNAERWGKVAPAKTLFDLCRTDPEEASRVLKLVPDLLLYHRPDPDTESELGPVLICGRGVIVGGTMLADPDSDVSVRKVAGGGYELTFGRHRHALSRRPVENFSNIIRGWLQYRASELLSYINGYLEPGTREVNNRVLTPFRLKCGTCGTVSVIAVGQVGTPVVEP